MAKLNKGLIAQVLAIFGPNGEHWTKNSFDTGEKVCMVGGFRRILGKDGGDAAAQELVPVIKKLYPEVGNINDVPTFNDRAGLDFIDMKNVLLAAADNLPA